MRKAGPLYTLFANLAEVGWLIVAERDRPKVRGDCKDGERPCPWVVCRHHNGIDVREGDDVRSIRITHLDSRSPVMQSERRGAEPPRRWYARDLPYNFIDDSAERVLAMPETCSLDVADRMGLQLFEVAEIVNLTKERVRQLEADAIYQIQQNPDAVNTLMQVM